MIIKGKYIALHARMRKKKEESHNLASYVKKKECGEKERITWIKTVLSTILKIMQKGENNKASS